MTNVALLIGDTIIYWNYVIAVLGIVAGIVFAFAIRPFTKVRASAVIVCIVLTLAFSFFFSRMAYYYCNMEQFVSIRDAMLGVPVDANHSVVGVIVGTLLAALIVRLVQLVKKTGKLLDTVFPGVILAIALYRLSCFFTGVFQSRIIIQNSLWQRLPFAVQNTDEAGNVSYVFAPFLISSIILFLTVFVIVLFARRRIKKPGDLFLRTFLIFVLSEMVLEGTRYDSLKLHFIYLNFLNKYVSFICFSMLVCAICVIIIFIVNYAKAVKKTGRRRCVFSLIVFIFGFIGFGICEYLVQRYTAKVILFHWMQAGFALLMAICVLTVINLKNTKTKKRRKATGNTTAIPVADINEAAAANAVMEAMESDEANAAMGTGFIDANAVMEFMEEAGMPAPES